MKYKHIVFDVDGTLIDTAHACLHSLQDTVREVLGKEMSLESLMFSLGIPGGEALSRLPISDVPAALKLWESNMQKYIHTACVFAGMTEVLEELTAAGCRLGIATSKTKHEYAQEFVIFGIDHYFDLAICADDTDEHKPHPAPLQKYMELSGCSKEDVLYIGDTEYDMKCAAGAGVTFGVAGWGCRQKLDALVFATPADIVKNVLG